MQQRRELPDELGLAGDDTALLARVAEFHDIYATATQASKEWLSEKARIEALLDAPPVDSPKFDGGAYDRHMAKHDINAWADKSHEAWERCGTAVNAIFDTPAHSWRGVAEKLKILRMALGDHQSDDNADEDLEAYQTTRPDEGPSWFEMVIADVERLAGTPTPEDPLLVLKREHDARYMRFVNAPRDDTDETADRLLDAVNEVGHEIFQTPATTVEGVAVKLVLWARQHVGHDATGLSWSREPVETYPMDLDKLPVVSALHDLERMAGWPVLTATPDDPIVRLGRRWDEVMTERSQLKDRDNNDPKHPDVVEDGRLHDAQLSIESSIAESPAHSPGGVAVKLRHLQRNETNFDGDAPWRADTFRTTLEALVRMAEEERS